MQEIPFFPYPKVYLDNREDYLKIIDKTASKGAFILQNELESFEKDIANYTGSKYAIGVANATDGLEISLMAMNVKPGDQVIC